MNNRPFKKILFSSTWWKKYGTLSNSWKGAIFFLSFFASLLLWMQATHLLAGRSLIEIMIGFLLTSLAMILFSGGVALFVHWLKKLPTRYIWTLISACLFLLFCFVGPLSMTIPLIIFTVLIVSILGAVLFHLVNGKLQQTSILRKHLTQTSAILLIILFSVSIYWYFHPGQSRPPITDLQTLKTNEQYEQNNLINPAKKGPYPVHSLTYGIPNSYREEFNKKTSLTSKTIDASKFLENWSSIRTKTLGFGPNALPLNGHVWYPEAAGSFPLVVITHGNYLMTKYSDRGYDYLGELLASKGYIVVSIDENFLNTSPYNDLLIITPLINENPARALLILEHLALWRNWQNNPNNPFFQKVNLDQIALIGHSRGGEAISIAAVFNELNHYPDDGRIAFDYHFSIRSLISIAGTDGQYKPADQSVSLKNVNYLALHGAHDMDVNSFDGMRQFERVQFSGQENLFKAAIYIYGANHGQFNEDWGRGDSAGIANQLFNLKQLLPRNEQEKIAKIFITAFLDRTLKNQLAYEKIFQDLGYAKDWLPKTLYIHDYQQANTRMLSHFSEDIDLNSTTIHGGKLQGKHLTKWREEKIKMKHGIAPIHAVRLGWNKQKQQEPATYSLILPQPFKTVATDDLVFSIADGNTTSTQELIDFSIEIEDRKGEKARLPISQIAKLVPAVEGKLLKWPFASSGETSEPIFQYYQFPLVNFQKQNPNINLTELKKIQFLFNRTTVGDILLKSIGIQHTIAH